MKLPFVYICSAMRSGSTFLQEALTKPPHSLILSEPRFRGTSFGFNNEMRQQVRAAGVPTPRGSNARAIFEDLNKHIGQVGVKEVRNWGWRGYLNGFKNEIKVIIIGRDPRDIYISAHGVFHRNSSWRPRHGMTPEGLYKEIVSEIEVQKTMAQYDFTIKVKYENLCGDFDNKFKEIKDFIGSPIPDVGEIGEFHKTISAGKHEVEMHKGKVTSKSVERWKIETNEKLLEEAADFFNLMTDYRELWRYK